MGKTRIIERTCLDGRVKFVIQQPHFLFRWQWVDGWVNSWCGAYCVDSFDTLEKAKANLRYFDGSKCKERVMS